MADFRVFAKFARTRLCGNLWNRGLRQNVFRWFHFKGILITRSLHLRRSVFWAAKFGPLYERFSPSPRFEKFEKMADFGVFAKFARTRLCGHLWTPDLRQIIIRRLLFKRILVGRAADLCRSVFCAAKFCALFERFSFGPPVKNFRKWPILMSLLNLPELCFAGTFGPAVCVKMLCDDCTLSAY